MGLVGRLLDATEVAACLIDPQDRIIGWNDSYLVHFPEHRQRIHVGWPYTENLRHYFVSNAEGLDPETREQRIRSAIDRHRHMQEPNVFQKGDGRWMRTHIHRLRDGSCIKMWADVTERFVGDRSVAAIFDTLGAVDVGVLQYDGELRFRFANRKAADLLPRAAALFDDSAHYVDHLGMIAQELDPREAHRLRSLIERQNPAEQPLQIAMILQRRDGGWLRFHERLTSDGGFSAILTDVTELKQMEDANDILVHQARELSQLTEQLGAARDAAVLERVRAEDASRAKSRFLATMTHELRTPLNAILGFSEILRDQRFGPIGQPRYGEYAGLIHEAGSHLLSLINDILDLSKIEAGRRELNVEPIHVEDLAADCLLLVRHRISVREIETVVRPAEGQEYICADERSAKQILVNLLTNAAKFTPAGGRITIETVDGGAEGVWLSVSDTGIGMTAAQVQRAMQPFGQVLDPLTRQQEGTGLGLPIVQALAEAHGGRLQIDSTPAQGTRVSILFPPRDV